MNVESWKSYENFKYPILTPKISKQGNFKTISGFNVNEVLAPMYLKPVASQPSDRRSTDQSRLAPDRAVRSWSWRYMDPCRRYSINTSNSTMLPAWNQIQEIVTTWKTKMWMFTKVYIKHTSDLTKLDSDFIQSRSCLIAWLYSMK